MSSPLTPGLEVVENLLTAIRSRDLSGILNAYEESDELYVFLEGPRWSSQTFHADLKIIAHEWIEGPEEITVEGLTSLHGILDMHTESPAQKKTLKVRGTWVLRKSLDAQWRIAHEHVSAPMEDPYGTGDWKK